MAVAVALLMIGGHFDLSAGVMTGTTALTVGIVAVEFEQNIWLAIAVALVVALAIGFLNGWLVTRTGLPSFIITLGTFLMLQGLNLGLTKFFTGTVTAGGIASVPGLRLGRGGVRLADRASAGAEVRIAVLWWVLFTALAAWVLLRTRFGNWVFATGGDEVAARNVGVPARRTTITLFMTTATAAWFVGTTLAVRLTSVQANAGIGQELIYIVAAVIGGCLLTGGFGSAVGAVARGADLRHDPAGHRLPGLGRRLVLLLPRRDAAARRAGQPAGPPLRRGGAAMSRRSGARCWSCATSARTSARSSPWTASARRCAPARSPACSATTAPASRR